MRDDLETLLRTRRARVGIIGLGYVGLPLVDVFMAAGFPTMGFDTDPEKVAGLAAGRSYIKHIPRRSAGAGSASSAWPTRRTSTIRGRARPSSCSSSCGELTPEFLAAQDCVLIATDHSAYDYAFIVEHARLVLDTRNATRHVTAGREKIRKA